MNEEDRFEGKFESRCLSLSSKKTKGREKGESQKVIINIFYSSHTH